jgi:hypothetical protein
MPNEEDSWESIPEALVTDLAQLTKANSIEGNKKDNVTVIYTPWSNLKKDGSMAVGQVSFKDPRKVKRVLVPTRENAIINRLNKTKVEKQPDFAQEREDMLKQRRRKDMAAVQARVSSWCYSSCIHFMIQKNCLYMWIKQTRLAGTNKSYRRRKSSV